MTAQQHQDYAGRFRRMAAAADEGVVFAQEHGFSLSAADLHDESEFWHLVAHHHEHCAEVRARTLLDA